MEESNIGKAIGSEGHSCQVIASVGRRTQIPPSPSLAPVILAFPNWAGWPADCAMAHGPQQPGCRRVLAWGPCLRSLKRSNNVYPLTVVQPCPVSVTAKGFVREPQGTQDDRSQGRVRPGGVQAIHWPADRGREDRLRLANALGGFVLFGVTDKGEIVGQQVATSTLEDVANELRRIEPPIFPDIETVALKGGNTVIALRVSGGGGPYTYDGRPYQRHGPTTRVMPRNVYEQRVMEKHHATTRWENQPVPNDVTIADLDEEEIQLTVDNAVDLGRLEPLKRRTTKAILTGLGLIVEGKLLNAAVPCTARARGCTRTTPSSPSAWPGSAARTGWATSSTTGSIGAMPSPCCAVRRRSSWITFPSRAAWYRAGCSARTGRSTRPVQRAKWSPTPSATATTPFPAARSAWPCTTTTWRSSTPAGCTSTSRRRSWPSRTSPSPGIRSSPGYSTGPGSSSSGARAR